MGIRFANVGGRAALLLAEGVVDVARASGGAFTSDPMAAIAEWDVFAAWGRDRTGADVTGPFTAADLGPPVPRPGKVFGIGMNYRDHAAEAKLEIPKAPVVFTKFPNCISGPY